MYLLTEFLSVEDALAAVLDTFAPQTGNYVHLKNKI